MGRYNITLYCPPLIITKKQLNNSLNIIEKGILINIEQKFLMEAIIVASGTGKRLGALGKKTPKCLLDLNKDIKIIDKIVSELSILKRINIVIGYKGNQIKKYLRSNNKIRFIFNGNYKDKGNFYSVLLCKKKIKSDLILLDADIIT